MSLRAIVAALGGDLYQNGGRANVPAPGHGAADRSVSLLLTEGRVVVHSFGAADWREVRDDLHRRGLIDRNGRLTGGALEPTAPRIDEARRIAVARALWDEGIPLSTEGVVARHLLGRGVGGCAGLGDLLEHPCAPYSVYRPGGRSGRAMMAAIRDPQGSLTAVELTYLSPNGRPTPGLRTPRKTVGRVPPGSAVRLSPAAADLLVAEGVVTTLSAMRRFGLPGWALMSAGNLARWSPPGAAANILIAGDRGRAGEVAAERLARRLRAAGREATIALPPPPSGDWNEAVRADRGGEKEGSGRAPDRRGWAPPTAGDLSCADPLPPLSP